MMNLTQVLLFWLTEQPDPDGVRMSASAWEAFIDSTAGWLLAAVLLATVAIVSSYVIHARRRRIRSPQDLFAPFTPLKWLLLSLAPAVVLGYRYYSLFEATFPTTAFRPTLSAIEVAAWTGLLTFILSHLIVMLPIITPSRYRFRPIWFVMRYVGRPAARGQES
jgi:hypothetical protein